MKPLTGEDLKKLRIRFDLTLTDIAELTGYGEVYLGLIEREIRPMNIHVDRSLTTLKFICDKGLLGEYKSLVEK